MMMTSTDKPGDIDTSWHTKKEILNNDVTMALQDTSESFSGSNNLNCKSSSFLGQEKNDDYAMKPQTREVMSLERHLWEILQDNASYQNDRVEYDADAVRNNYSLEPYAVCADNMNSSHSIQSVVSNRSKRSRTGGERSFSNMMEQFSDEEEIGIFSDDDTVFLPIDLRLPKLRHTSICTDIRQYEQNDTASYSVENGVFIRKSNSPHSRQGSPMNRAYARAQHMSSTTNENSSNEVFLLRSAISMESAKRVDMNKLRFIPLAPSDVSFIQSINRRQNITISIKLKEIHEIIEPRFIYHL